MSVIGPRPALWNQDVLTAERDKYGANDVKPGLTGWAQINGRDELEIPVKAKLDGEYVQKESLLFDIKCFLVLLGQQLNPYPYLKMCDIYFQPSRHEGYGIAVAEARAFCKPIVSTNFAGAQEQLINNETGIITECTIESMYRGVKLLLDNYNDFQHRFSKNLAAQKGIDKNQVCLLEQIFEQV